MTNDQPTEPQPEIPPTNETPTSGEAPTAPEITAATEVPPPPGVTQEAAAAGTNPSAPPPPPGPQWAPAPEPTAPVAAASSRRPSRNTALVAGASVAAGLLLGIAGSQLVDDHDGRQGGRSDQFQGSDTQQDSRQPSTGRSGDGDDWGAGPGGQDGMSQGGNADARSGGS